MQEVHNLLSVRKNLTDLLNDRHYIIPDEFKDFTITDSSYFLKNKKNPDFHVVTKENGKVLIKFILFEHIRPNLIKENILELLTNTPGCHIIIILKKKPNNSILKLLKYPEYNMIEIFWYNELLINICNHNLVPKHEILSMEDEEILLLTLRIESKQHLPQIFKSDPISKWYGAELGNIFKISRNSIAAGNTTFYRCVK